jgi:16S rRNA C967 or C1407 C5-methylase (RsmB/RsmF family)/NOL1/NOP2/fmu family ribosome biogenesis protein
MDFKQHFIKSFGEENYLSFELGLNDLPKIGLIINPNKTNINFIKSVFNDFTNHPLIENALIYHSSIKLGKHPLFHGGAFYIQDPSAMMVASILTIEPGDKVIDVAAAPGGKSFQVATRLNESGLLIANDLNYNRAKVLSSNIEKYGFKNVYVTSNTTADLVKYHAGLFDKVILDAPCSGEGMFRKDELAKNDWSYDKVTACALTQKQLIIDSYKLLRKGGMMIYSTCTFSIEENEQVIKHLLANSKAKLIKIFDDPRFKRGLGLAESIRLFPFIFPGEGHFIALIQSNDDYNATETKFKSSVLDKNNFTIVDNFLKTYTTIKLEKSRLSEINNQIYCLPKTHFNTYGLNVLRSGWLIGSIEKNIFFPQHSLAMGLASSDFKNVINLDLASKELATYLKGEAISSSGDGYHLICSAGISLGFAKISNGIFKNHYPKGLRNK